MYLNNYIHLTQNSFAFMKSSNQLLISRSTTVKFHRHFAYDKSLPFPENNIANPDPDHPPRWCSGSCRQSDSVWCCCWPKWFFLSGLGRDDKSAICTTKLSASRGFEKMLFVKKKFVLLDFLGASTQSRRPTKRIIYYNDDVRCSTLWAHTQNARTQAQILVTTTRPCC